MKEYLKDTAFAVKLLVCNIAIYTSILVYVILN